MFGKKALRIDINKWIDIDVNSQPPVGAATNEAFVFVLATSHRLPQAQPLHPSSVCVQARPSSVYVKL